MLACGYRLNLHLEAVGTFSFVFFFFLFYNFLIHFVFVFTLITPQSLASFFDALLPVTLHWSSPRPNRNVDFVVLFFFPTFSIFFFTWTNVTVAHQALYIFTVLPFLMSVKSVDHFVSITSWSFMSVCMICVREAVLNKKKTKSLLYAVPFECVHASPAVCTMLTFWWAWPLKMAPKLSTAVENVTWGE